MPRVARVVAVMIALVAFVSTSCTKRAPGRCVEDIDCSPGFDCRAGLCVRRDRVPGSNALPDPRVNEAVHAASAPPAAEEHPDASAVTDGASDAAPRPRLSPTPRAAPGAVTPSPGVPPSAPSHEPLWKQRRKNS